MIGCTPLGEWRKWFRNYIGIHEERLMGLSAVAEKKEEEKKLEATNTSLPDVSDDPFAQAWISTSERMFARLRAKGEQMVPGNKRFEHLTSIIERNRQLAASFSEAASGAELTKAWEQRDDDLCRKIRGHTFR